MGTLSDTSRWIQRHTCLFGTALPTRYTPMDAGTLTTRELAAELGCDDRTARRLLSRLHAKGIATRVQTAGRPSYAISRAALAALSGEAA